METVKTFGSGGLGDLARVSSSNGQSPSAAAQGSGRQYSRQDMRDLARG